MTDKVKISVIIVTFNEEKRIRRCLDSIGWVDEIVVVDQFSTDSTVAICREYTEKVCVVTNKGFCEPDRPVALSKTSNEWTLYLDADESVSCELRREIESTLGNILQYDGYYVPRKNIYLGKWIRYSGWYPGYVLRLFKKNKVIFSERIHADVVLAGRCGYMKNDLLHYTYENINEHVSKMIRYTNVLAEQAYIRGERITTRNFLWKLFILPAIYFLKKYVWMQGYRDGIRGLLIGAFTFVTGFMASAKLWERQSK